MLISGRIENKEIKSGNKQDGTKWNRLTFTVNGHKYSTFNESFVDFNSGENVEIEYDKSQDGKYNTVKTIKKIGGESLSNFRHETDNEEFVDRQRLIVRQNCLTQVGTMMSNLLKQVELGLIPKETMQKPITILEMTALAKEFENYVFGE